MRRSRHPARASRRSGRAPRSAGADRAGRVAHAPRASVPASFSCPVVLVDGGVLPESGAARHGGAGSGSTPLVARGARRPARGPTSSWPGSGDGDSPVRPRAVVAAGPSFRRRAAHLGVDAAAGGRAAAGPHRDRAGPGGGVRRGAVTGRPLTVSAAAAGRRPTLVAGRVGVRDPGRDAAGGEPAGDRLARRRHTPLWALRRRRAVVAPWAAARAAVPRVAAVAGVAVAAVPVSTFVVNLVPWWRLPARRRWCSSPVLAVVVAAADRGARLLGGRPLTAGGAAARRGRDARRARRGTCSPGRGCSWGRCSGRTRSSAGGSTGWGTPASRSTGWRCSSSSAWVAGVRAVARRCRRALALVVLVAALAIEALPSLGADFGGPPGLLLGGLLVIALGRRGAAHLAAGARRRVVGAGVLAALVAWLDWLRPAGARTHLGEFVESVVTGEAGAVVGRKLAQNLANLGSPPLLAIAVATVVLVVAAWRVGWRPVRPRRGGAARWRVVMAVVGFVVNDSGPGHPGVRRRRCSRPCSWPPVPATGPKGCREPRSVGGVAPRARRARRGCRGRPWGG